MLKALKKKSGVSFIEVLIALAILGIIATAFITAIFVATMSIAIADERTNAESLAKTQMEYVKQQPYNDSGLYFEIDLDGTQYLEGTPYSIWSVDSEDIIVEEIVAVPWDSQNDEAAPADVGLQKIILKIFHGDREVLTLEGYKVDEGIY